MATLNFSNASDLKVFTPISSALSNLPNGAGTIIALVRKTFTSSGQDVAGLQNSAATAWYHGLQHGNDQSLADDDGITSTFTGASFTINNTTDWMWIACDWPAGATGTTERYHYFNHTAGGSWSHQNSSSNNGGNRAGPGTSGWLRIGNFGDQANGCMDCALIAIWAGVRFADANYSDWTKTSQLYNHSAGTPTTLIEMISTSPTDIGANPSTYSSSNSSGTALTGSNPPNFTFDGTGLVLQQVRPDADNATVGSWVTSPYWSKLNDQSDASIITGTLS